MKKTFKKIFIVLFSAIILLVGTAPISNAESKYLIVVNSRKNTLNYYVNYTLVRAFRCSTGKASSPTPQAKTTIVNKIKNRPYYQGHIPGGAPNNPLGKRWMGLNLNGTYGTTYAIHGNNNESSIGKNVTGGCVRMHNSEVEWLFDQVPVGTVVLIKNTSESDDYITRYYNMGSLKAAWYTEDNKKYYKNPDGTLAKGWNTIDGNKYYFGTTTGKLYTGWSTINGSKYYFGKNGVRVTGWQTIDGKKYYFSPTTGKLYTGWSQIGSNTYYFSKTSGKLYTGWSKIGGKTYYLGSDGAKQTGWVTVDGAKYYLGENGVRRTGWQTIGSHKYFFGKSTGKLCTGWAEIGGKKYYLGDNGVMVTGKQTIDGVVYEFDSNGVLITGNTDNTDTNKPSQDTTKPDDNTPSQDTTNDDQTTKDDSSKEDNSQEQNKQEQQQEESSNM
ncbi:N-acetylmuramoyl-L-alanine amidase family protein [Intestinibacter bartlettii]|uniref:L,D-transpeptidase family protein n=1 Tax=Intestinibacter bartlettii TaxID=261299 RepID=A0ABS6DXG3_9FIRM|nr:L,D-transpeptidase family protein [Intestinibacter bartlettii]MBU5336538.1 L,D-transpeptidase family protein [Intestinibacter bartlettii]